MIISKFWLNEFVNLSDISGEILVKTLNSIGLEVSSHIKLNIPKTIVVGYVKSCQKHPDADKLNICQVDVGAQTLQIVCGAKNVEVGQFVPVALVGSVMPNGLEIKKAKLRGVESFGMICSASELGMVKVNDGILPLDDSVGQLKLGASVCEFEAFSDDIIEVDITANRGDCQSMHGIARDICAALNLNLKDISNFQDSENLLGIGRIVSVRAEDGLNGSFLYRAFEIKDDFNENLLTRMRLALIGCEKKCAIERLLDYATHCTGVLFRAYDYAKFNDERVIFDIKNGQNGECVVCCGDKILGVAGIYQSDEARVSESSKIIIIEASYCDLNIIARAIAEDKKMPKDAQTYRSTRGSEPNLAYGADFLFHRLSAYKNISLYAGSQQYNIKRDQVVINVSLNRLKNMIGQEIERNEMVKILKKLSFEVNVNVEQESINVKVPFFRHDILNSYDICEEIVRMVGIDNIAPKPLIFSEQNRLTPAFIDYKNALNLRSRAANCGFFESVHYIFDSSDELKNLGFLGCKVAIANPITSELDTLRPTLINHLLKSCERNIKNSKKSVRLFELGDVFNEQGEQSKNLGFVVSGLIKEPTLINGAKGEEVGFYSFAAMIQNVIGKFELILSDDIKYLNPYEQAKIAQNGEILGYIGRVNAKVESARDLPKTYLCELNFNAIKFLSAKASAYSKFPSISRDLSLIVPDGFRASEIYECIKSLNLSQLKEFLPVDIYRGSGLKDASSISFKFSFQDMQKTLEDSEVNALMDKILSALKDRLGISIR